MQAGGEARGLGQGLRFTLDTYQHSTHEQHLLVQAGGEAFCAQLRDGLGTALDEALEFEAAGGGGGGGGGGGEVGEVPLSTLIMQLVLSCVAQPAPNLAHLLLGFEVRAAHQGCLGSLVWVPAGALPLPLPAKQFYCRSRPAAQLLNIAPTRIDSLSLTRGSIPSHADHLEMNIYITQMAGRLAKASL